MMIQVARFAFKLNIHEYYYPWSFHGGAKNVKYAHVYILYVSRVLIIKVICHLHRDVWDFLFVIKVNMMVILFELHAENVYNYQVHPGSSLPRGLKRWTFSGVKTWPPSWFSILKLIWKNMKQKVSHYNFLHPWKNLAYLPTWIVDCYLLKIVGKYTIFPWILFRSCGEVLAILEALWLVSCPTDLEMAWCWSFWGEVIGSEISGKKVTCN